jgi:hypothetical protein
LRATDCTARSPLNLLALAALFALSLLPALAISQEGNLSDAPMSEGNDASAQATTEAGSGQGNNAAAKSGGDTLTSEVVPPEEGFIERAARAFTESDLVFARSFSNAPFLPVAFLGGTHYGDATVSGEGATPDIAGAKYRVNSTSQYAGVPFLLSKRSMAVLGEYVSYADFSVDNGEEFSVTSASIAAGYLYQVNPDWQVIAALVPFYNHSSLGERGQDYWQVMGGAVARYTRNDRLWWLFGVVFDDSDFGTSVLPYVGASLTLTERWSVSAILPWPQLMYAPSKDWFLSLGASYSGNSWAVNNTTGAVGLNLSGFDFGFGGAMRLKGPLWLEGSVGVGGLRALTITDGDVSGPSIDVSSSPFFKLSLTFRPSFAD